MTDKLRTAHAKRQIAAMRISELMERDGFPGIPIGAYGYETRLLEYIEYLKKRQAPVYYEREPLQ